MSDSLDPKLSKRPSARRDTRLISKVAKGESQSIGDSEKRVVEKIKKTGSHKKATRQRQRSTKQSQERNEKSAGSASKRVSGRRNTSDTPGPSEKRSTPVEQIKESNKKRYRTKPSPSGNINSATPRASKGFRGIQGYLNEFEQGLASLIRDVGLSEGDVRAARRALDAIAQIASQLDSQESQQRQLEGTTLFRTARDLLSTDYSPRQLGPSTMRDRFQAVDDFGLNNLFEVKTRPLFELICKHYFRIQVEGIRNIPDEGGALLICNHGGAVPWDGIMLNTAIRLNHPTPRELRWLVEDFIFNLPFLGILMNRIGAVRACQENAERILSKEKLLAVFPEGSQGTGKLYAERYKLKQFGRGDYIQLALRTGTPIIPVAIVGSEEVNPLLYKITTFSNRLGLPYFPITPMFPWLGPLGLMPLPVQWRIVFCERFEELDRYGPESEGDEHLVSKINERIRKRIQDKINLMLTS